MILDDTFLYCYDCGVDCKTICTYHRVKWILNKKIDCSFMATDLQSIFSKYTTGTIVHKCTCDQNDKKHIEKTLPDSLLMKPSRLYKNVISVWSLDLIPRGTIFGPFCGIIFPVEDDVNDIYERSINGNAWFIHKSKEHGIDRVVNGTNPFASNWMRSVSCSMEFKEQNMVAIQYDGFIFYRACEDISSNTELVVNGEVQHERDVDINKGRKLKKSKVLCNENLYLNYNEKSIENMDNFDIINLTPLMKEKMHSSSPQTNLTTDVVIDDRRSCNKTLSFSNDSLLSSKNKITSENIIRPFYLSVDIDNNFTLNVIDHKDVSHFDVKDIFCDKTIRNNNVGKRCSTNIINFSNFVELKSSTDDFPEYKKFKEIRSVIDHDCKFSTNSQSDGLFKTSEFLKPDLFSPVNIRTHIEPRGGLLFKETKILNNSLMTTPTTISLSCNVSYGQISNKCDKPLQMQGNRCFLKENLWSSFQLNRCNSTLYNLLNKNIPKYPSKTTKNNVIPQLLYKNMDPYEKCYNIDEESINYIHQIIKLEPLLSIENIIGCITERFPGKSKCLKYDLLDLFKDKRIRENNPSWMCVSEDILSSVVKIFKKNPHYSFEMVLQEIHIMYPYYPSVSVTIIERIIKCNFSERKVNFIEKEILKFIQKIFRKNQSITITEVNLLLRDNFPESKILSGIVITEILEGFSARLKSLSNVEKEVNKMVKGIFKELNYN